MDKSETLHSTRQPHPSVFACDNALNNYEEVLIIELQQFCCLSLNNSNKGMVMRNLTLLIKSTAVATVLVFFGAGTAFAQGYSADQVESPAPYGGATTGSDVTDKDSGYGTKDSGERGQYGTRRSSGDKYGGSYQGSAGYQGNDLYNHSDITGTGPHIKGRY
jgi:hypothetical protein